jgi:ribosomally synthesized peptide (two-chain TOMM family)
MSTQESYGTYDRFLEFRAVIMQSIARAWRDENYRVSLIADPKQALKAAFDYDFPFNMNLSVNVDNAKWEQNTVGDWLVFKQNKLIMVLPPAPEQQEQLEALASFNAHHLTFLD